jgi:GntR family transcriptional regulator
LGTVLNPETGIPLYRQVANELSEGIYSGKYQVGSRIPGEEELATAYGIGRPTVRQATDLLVRRGLLERRRGAGTFVLSPREQVDLFQLIGTSEAFKGAGLSFETRIVEPTRRVKRLGIDAGPLANSEGFTFTRLGKIEKVAVLVEHLYLSESVFPDFDQLSLEQQSLSRLVEQHYERRPTGGKQTLSVIELNKKDARLLGVESKRSALLVERRLDFKGAPGSIFVRLSVLTERVALTQTLTLPNPGTIELLAIEKKQ